MIDQSWRNGLPVSGVKSPTASDESWNNGQPTVGLFTVVPGAELEAAVTVAITTNAPDLVISMYVDAHLTANVTADLSTHIVVLASVVSPTLVTNADLTTVIALAAAVTVSGRTVLDSVPLRAAVQAKAVAWIDSQPLRAAVTVRATAADAPLTTVIALVGDARATVIATFGNLEFFVTATALASLTTQIPLAAAVRVSAVTQLTNFSFSAAFTVRATATGLALATGIALAGHASATASASFTPGAVLRAAVVCTASTNPVITTGISLGGSNVLASASVAYLAPLAGGWPYGPSPKHWINGRPVKMIVSPRNPGTMDQWRNGLPVLAVFPSAWHSGVFLSTSIRMAAAVRCAATVSPVKLRIFDWARIVGSIYLATGNLVQGGNLHLTPARFIIMEGRLSSTLGIVYTIPTNGVLNIPIIPSLTVPYRVEYDPTPLDTSIPMSLKPGYWLDTWYIPDVSSIDIKYLDNKTPPYLGPDP